MTGKIIRTDSGNSDFRDLVKLLDDYMTITDGNQHDFYDQFNKLDKIKYVVVVYENEQPIACGAMKYFNDQSVEIKRMYTLPIWRGKGIASGILAELETWARELKYEKCVLETGKRQTEAVELYKRRGFKIIPNYGQYEGIENSICFEKLL